MHCHEAEEHWGTGQQKNNCGYGCGKHKKQVSGYSLAQKGRLLDCSVPSVLCAGIGRRIQVRGGLQECGRLGRYRDLLLLCK